MNEKWILVDSQAEQDIIQADLVWHKNIKINQLKPQSVYNHWINGQVFLHNKGLYKRILEEQDKKYQYNIVNSSIFYPKTYTIDLTSPNINEEEREFFDEVKSGIYIKKPIHGARGEGIKLIEDLIDFKQSILLKKPHKKINVGFYDRKYSMIVQKYIENPLLIENKKFDIRCYLIFTSIKPFVAFFHHGYVRRSLLEYSLKDLKNSFIHLVNQAVQKRHKMYTQQQNNTVWSMQQLEQYLIQNNKSQKDIEILYEKIKLYMTYLTMSIYNQKIARVQGQFQIFGIDITVDNALNPFLIEANIDPQIGSKNPKIVNIVKQMVASLFAVEEQILDNKNDLTLFYQKLNYSNLQGLELLFSEVNNYNFISELEKRESNK